MLKLDLLDNALDFLADAVDQLSDADLSKTRIKYAVLHLSSAVELLLKQRLLNEHWSLIFSDINKADKTLLDSGDFKSVDFGESLNRLTRICGITFSRHKQVLENLKRLRNRIEHYQFSISEDEAESLLVKTWSFVLEFVSDHLDSSLSEEAREALECIREKMVKHETFIDQRTQEIQNQLEEIRQDQTVILDCPFCLQDALPMTGEETRCLFCKRAFSADQVQDEWLTLHEGWHYQDPKEMATDPLLHECPSCKDDVGLYRIPDALAVGRS